jgi:hypothetical protein
MERKFYDNGFGWECNKNKKNLWAFDGMLAWQRKGVVSDFFLLNLTVFCMFTPLG